MTEERKRGTVVVTCPGCRRKFVARFTDIIEAEEYFCPYCGRSFGTKGNLAEEIQKELDRHKRNM